ncbi:MAG: hypothetical protein HY719_09560, partial [Planctomycetes bacterium]|nr:hypothetical protein [Planctomycetota bacterium]
LREMVYEKVEEPARAGDIVFATLLFPRAGAEPRREEGVVLAVSSPKWHGVALGAAPTPSAPDAGGAAQPKEKEAVKPVAAKPEAAPGKPDEKPKDEAAAAKPAEKLPLEGLAAGQFVEMTATFTADHEDKDLAGKSGSLRVSVEEVQRLSSGGLGGALAWMAERNLVIGLIMAAFCMLMAWPYAKFGLFLLGAAAGVMLANNLMGSAMDANMTLMGTIIGGLGLGLLSLWTMSIILILVTSVAGASMITVSLLFMITRMGVSAGDGRVWNADYLLNQWQLAVLIFSGLLALVGLYVQFFKTKKKPKPAV